MEVGNNTSSKRIHLRVATAAVALTLVSLTGVAAMTGLLPDSRSANSPVTALDAKDKKETATEKTGGKSDTNDRKTAKSASGETVSKPTKPTTQNVAAAPSKNTVNEARDVRETPVADRPDYAQRAPQTARASYCDSCGRVESIRAIQQAAQPSGVGIAAGAVIGGLLGNQVGGGNGRTIATVAGAVGGGYAGNEVEKRTRSTTTYEIQVRMENGSMRTIPQSSSNGWQVGDRVKLVNGNLVSNS